MSLLLEIKDLSVGVDEKEILKGINLQINPGEVHVVMGPNGAGKSTLANAIMAHPKYHVMEGDIIFEGESILEETADQRARRGIFMSFQTPYEVNGVTVEDFLRTAKSQNIGKNLPILKFKKELKQKMELLNMNSSYANRYLNVGFSGGEKKKNEILQMQILDPKFVLLDETDSGLDVDAVRIVSKGVSEFLDETKSCLIITHNNAIFEFIKPTHVHVVMDGVIVKEGGPELADNIQSQGYEWIREELREKFETQEEIDA